MTNCTRPKDTHAKRTSVASVMDPWDRVIISNTSRLKSRLFTRSGTCRLSSEVFGVRDLFRCIKKERLSA